MPQSFEIYFHDLNEDAQRNYMEFQGVSSSDELNEDICPLAIIERSDEDDA